MTEGAVGTGPLTPLQKPKAVRKPRAAGGAKRAAKGQQQRAASTASAGVEVPCSDEAPELVDIKQELPDVKVQSIALLLIHPTVIAHRRRQCLLLLGLARILPSFCCCASLTPTARPTLMT